MRTPFAAFALALLVLASNADHADFHPDRVHLIDHDPASGNFLFRGNEPVEVLNGTSTFIYDTLVDRLAVVAEKEGNLTLPEDVYIIDICLLNVFEKNDENTEKDFFEKNPHLGHWVNWVIVGDLIPPSKDPHSLAKELGKHLQSWQLDHLVRRIPQLRKMLLTKNDKPTVIYIHCEAGEDRTGEVSGSYYMKYLGWSYSKALAYDDHVETRDIKKMSQNGLEWYCYYLKYGEKRSDLDCPQ